MNTGPLKQALREYEARSIETALVAHGWRRRETAHALGICYRSLAGKIKLYALKKKKEQTNGA